MWITDTKAFVEACMRFNPTAYWSTREIKVWVVNLETGPRRKADRQTMYVRAQTREGAITCAKVNSCLCGSKRVAGARLATPSDLGCNAVRVQS